MRPIPRMMYWKRNGRAPTAAKPLRGPRLGSKNTRSGPAYTASTTCTVTGTWSAAARVLRSISNGPSQRQAATSAYGRTASVEVFTWRLPAVERFTFFRDARSLCVIRELRKHFRPGQVLRGIGKAVIGGFVVNEYLTGKLPRLILAKQPDGNGIEGLLFQSIEQMRATLFAKPALGPLGRCVYADVGIALKADTVFTLHCQQRAPAPLAAYTTVAGTELVGFRLGRDRKSTRLNSSHVAISYAVFCLKKKEHSSPPSTVIKSATTTTLVFKPVHACGQ